MTDTYIDAFETVSYGRIACDQMRKILLPLHPAWTESVNHVIALQTEKNDRMAELLTHIRSPTIDQAAIEAAGDAVIRFGAWLQSLKGRPIDPALFFGDAAPSDIARQRLSKFAGRLGQIVERLTPFTTGGDDDGEKVVGVTGRLAELTEARDAMLRMSEQQRAARVERRTYSPQIEQGRQEWLATYVANKRFAEAVLRHHDKLSLLSVIFDDLAEVQVSSMSAQDLAGLTDGVGEGDAAASDASASDANATGGEIDNS